MVLHNESVAITAYLQCFSIGQSLECGYCTLKCYLVRAICVYMMQQLTVI